MPLVEVALICWDLLMLLPLLASLGGAGLGSSAVYLMLNLQPKCMLRQQNATIVLLHHCGSAARS